VAERRFTEFSGDVSGRYIGALATASRVYGTQVPGLDGLVAKAIALQKPDGYFGREFHYDKPTDLDLALLWGNGRMLVGLMEYYRLKPSSEVLAASKRLGDWLVRIAPLMLSKEIREGFGAQHFASSYICWTQQTEGLAALYQVTKDERYRKLAKDIFAVTERRPSDHVHGYLCSVRGAVDLHAVTGDGGLLAKCEAAWADIAGSQDALITGGVPEGWSPNNHRTEGCGEADWLRLNLALWKATGKVKYLAMAEKTAFNEFVFNQFATGDFGHHVYTDTGLPAGGAARAWWCCTLHGLRCFPDVQENAFGARMDGLSFDLPVDAETKSEILSARSTSTLGRDGAVKVTITSASKESDVLQVRKPEWADGISLCVNNKKVEAAVTDGYARIERSWKLGDEVEVRYIMSLRSEESGKDRVSYWYGPWLLGAPAAENPAYFNELTADNRLLARIGNAVPASRAGSFAVPVAAQAFRYRHAEYADQLQTVTLRAIAEQAGQGTTSWELRFLRNEPA
jgi:DUF1680 family protein